MKLLHRLIYVARQPRDRLRTDCLARHDRDYPSHLTRADAAQKCFPNEQRYFWCAPLKLFQPRRQKALPARARNAQSQRSQHRYEIALVITVTIIAALLIVALVGIDHRKAIS